MLIEALRGIGEDALVSRQVACPDSQGDRPRCVSRERAQLFPAKLPGLHRAPVTVEAFVARDGRPGIRLAAFVGDGLVGDQFSR